MTAVVAATGGQYLAAAYVVVLATVLAYLVIIGLKLARLDRDLADLASRVRRRREEERDREEARVG